MLRVKNKLDFSELHGLGVFADEPIKKGQMVIRFHRDFDLVFRDDEMEKLPKAMRDAIEYYGFRNERLKVYTYNVDNERFMNHSEDPNLISGRQVVFALRDIAVGEELTMDYRTFCDECASDGVESIFRDGPAFFEQDEAREEQR
jgi:SET domain-containing protein